jgi:nucleoside 2-deoxyribosyltransferase
VRIYVAAALGEAHVARLIANVLANHGYAVCSHWHGLCLVSEVTDPRARRECLAENLADLTRCDVVVAWTAAGVPRATYGEIGYALALGKRVVWIQGERAEGACIFDADPGVVIVRGAGEAAMLAAVAGVVSGRVAA